MPGFLTPKVAGGLIVLALAVAAPWILSPYDLNLLGRFLALSLTPALCANVNTSGVERLPSEWVVCR